MMLDDSWESPTLKDIYDGAKAVIIDLEKVI